MRLLPALLLCVLLLCVVVDAKKKTAKKSEKSTPESKGKKEVDPHKDWFSPVITWGNATVYVKSVIPPIFMIKNFMSADECEFVKRTAEPHLKVSETLGGLNKETRDSKTTFLSEQVMQHPQMKVLFNRIGRFVDNPPVHSAFQLPKIDIRNAETFQIAKYEVGGYYKIHNDFSDADPTYDRSATFIVYLQDVPLGGETMFPYLALDKDSGMYQYTKNVTDFRTVEKCKAREPFCNKTLAEKYRTEEILHCCCDETLKARPTKGDALLFFPATKEGKRNPLTAHAGCPVVQGTKYILQQWFHLKGGQHLLHRQEDEIEQAKIDHDHSHSHSLNDEL